MWKVFVLEKKSDFHKEEFSKCIDYLYGFNKSDY